jgi:hypothetical protein
VRRMSVIAASLLTLCSCLAFQPRQAQDLYIEPGYAETIKNAELILDSLTVRKGFDSQALEANAAYILQLMLARRNQDSADPGSTLFLRALIKEEEFSREFHTLNTVTVELSIFDPPESNAVALALYSENTKDTIESYAYLHSVIRRAFRQLVR